MDQQTQIQPWKLDQAVVEHMAKYTKNATRVQPSEGRANYEPEGEMLFNGGQSAGHVFDKPNITPGQLPLFYDTEKRTEA